MERFFRVGLIKKVILGAVAISALALTSVSFADDHGPRGDCGHRGPGPMMMLGLADANGDNVVTRAEVDALQTQEFAYRDRNGDGFLDRQDASPIRQRAGEKREERREAREDDADAHSHDERARGERRGPRRGDRRARMRQLDTDNDRRISQAEFLAGTDRIFERLDTNQDGSITGEEIEASIAERQGRRSDRGWWRD